MEKRTVSKKATIIVPCYNSEAFLTRCLTSLEKIKNPDVEFLLIDDGSTDNSLQIMRNHAQREGRIRIATKKNGGYCSALNLGIELAAGEYIMFLGSDDEIVSDGLDTLLSTLDSRADIVCFATERIFETKERALDPLTRYENLGVFGGTLFEVCDRVGNDANILFVRDTSRLFKKTVIGETRYFGRVGVSADGAFSSIVASKAQCFQFSNICCYRWYLRSDSLSGRRKTVATLLDEAVVWDFFFSSVRRLFGKDPIPIQIERYIWAYWGVYESLKVAKEKSYKSVRRALKGHIRWLSKAVRLPFKERIYLFVPGLYYRHYSKQE